MEEINIINTIIGGSVAILGLVLGYFIGLKKYAFEKIYEQKLIIIKNLYRQIVDLEFKIKEYVYFIGADTQKESIGKRIKSLNEVKNNFQKFQHEFWREEIILNKSTVILINNFLKKYIEITSKLTVSNIQQQQGDFKQSFDNWDESFKLISSDLVGVKNKLKKEFRKTLKL